MIFEELRSGRANVALPQLGEAISGSEPNDVYFPIGIDIERVKDCFPSLSASYALSVQIYAKDLDNFSPGPLIESSVKSSSTDFVGVTFGGESSVNLAENERAKV